MKIEINECQRQILIDWLLEEIKINEKNCIESRSRISYWNNEKMQKTALKMCEESEEELEEEKDLLNKLIGGKK